MELAKITTRGQLTLPIQIRKKLGVKDGDKVVFIEENGRIIVENAVMVALREVQTAFEGEAERAGIQSEQDIVDLASDERREMWEETTTRATQPTQDVDRMLANAKRSMEMEGFTIDPTLERQGRDLLEGKVSIDELVALYIRDAAHEIGGG